MLVVSMFNIAYYLEFILKLEAITHLIIHVSSFITMDYLKF
jgi:hypothetical protein